ncbi:MAG: hypothetical protein IZT55_04935 [Anaerolineae bacterium]|nr:hypothetical protein [Anaerolineae bacterium]
MNDYSLGITLSLMGITITFLALGALILLIVLLRAMFPSKAPAIKESTRTDIDLDSRAAAIAAAWWYLHNKKADSLGTILEQPPGQWRNSAK